MTRIRALDWPFIRHAVATWGLLAWFVALDVSHLLVELPVAQPLGHDAIIYARGAAAFLAGGSPWDAYLQGGTNIAHFAGLPPTVIAFLPFAGLPEPLTGLIWVALAMAASVAVLRRLRLPPWWLAFPPLVEGIYSGNPHLAVLFLVVCLPAWSWLAPVLKVYAVVPMIGERQWRSLALAGLVFAASLVLVPGLWSTYGEGFTAISARLQVEAFGGFSAYRDPLLLAITLGALALLALVDLRAAGWLAVPAVWPATQFHYATLALPVMTAPLGFLLALPVDGLPAVAISAYAVYRLIRVGPDRLADLRARLGTRQAALS